MRTLAILLGMAGTVLADCPSLPLFHSYTLATQISQYLITDAPGATSGPSNWSIVSAGQLRQSSNIYLDGDVFPERNGTVAWIADRCWSDFHLSVQVRPTDNDDWGLLFHAQSLGTDVDGYRLHFGRDAHLGRHLHKQSGGLWTELAASPEPGFTLSDWQTLEVDAVAGLLEVRMDGTLLLSAVDAEFTEGSIGFFCFAQQGLYLDNLWVGPPGSGADFSADVVVAASIQPGNAGNIRPDPQAMVGPPDGGYTSLGGVCAENTGPAWAILDMGPDDESIVDGPGNDLEVVEIGSASGGVNEYYQVSLGDGPDGPWDSLGVGLASTQFDLAAIGRCAARYLRIDDLSSATCGVETPGADIDGVVALHLGAAAGGGTADLGVRMAEDGLWLEWIDEGCAHAWRVEGSATPYLESSWETVAETATPALWLGALEGLPATRMAYRVRSLGGRAVAH
jgi:hypothetical protein